MPNWLDDWAAARPVCGSSPLRIQASRNSYGCISAIAGCVLLPVNPSGCVQVVISALFRGPTDEKIIGMSKDTDAILLGI